MGLNFSTQAFAVTVTLDVLLFVFLVLYVSIKMYSEDRCCGKKKEEDDCSDTSSVNSQI